MAEFADRTGRTWHPRVTTRVLMDFEQRTGTSFFDRVARAQVEPTELIRSMGELMALAWLACRAEAAERSVNEDMFVDAVGGGELLAASEACGEALRGYLPAVKKGQPSDPPPSR